MTAQGALRSFHDELVESYLSAGLSPGHAVDKMRELWGYLAHSFEDRQRIVRRLRKVRTMDRYRDVVDELFV